MYADKYASKPSEVPTTRHWAIIKGSSHTDSYGETGYHLTYEVYLTKYKWEKAINELEQERGFAQPYIAIEAAPALVERKIVVAPAK